MESKKLHVLVVEDEGIIARDITSMLEQLGYEVSGEAGTGAEAMELASMVATDLVLMDIKLRGAADGIQTAAQIREQFGIPVVFLTSHADSETLQRANQTQPFGYVVKPFNEADLKVAIEVGLNRHRLHQETEGKQGWFDAALSSLSDAVIATDTDGRIQHFNRAAEKLTGWRGSDVVGRRFADVIQAREEGSQGGEFNLDAVLCSHEPVPFASVLLQHRNGSERLVVGSIGPMRRPGSALLHGTVTILRDASGLLPTGRDALLRRSNEHLQELSYALSHDLTEPVRNMTCFAQLLERQGRSALDEASREYLTFISEGSKRLDAHLKALREFYQAGSASAGFDDSDAQEVCGDVLKILGDAILESEAQVTVEELPFVALSAATLHDILKALLSNALRFRSERKLQIRVRACRAGSHLWQFTVEDNGLGFEAKEAERIFQLFTKAHEPQRCGSGVGLAICRRLVESAGGRIWAESEPGQGSQFHFTLPAGRNQTQAA